MPITKAAGQITLQYQTGDTKGYSWATAWTLEDIYNTAVAEGWTDDFKKEGLVYTTNCEIRILNAATFVHFYAATIQWTAAVGSWLIDVAWAYFDIGTDGTVERQGCTMINNCGVDKSYRLFGRIRIYDTTFTGDRLPFGNGAIYPCGVADYQLILERCTFINMTYCPSFNSSGASYANVINRDSFVLNCNYGIQLYGTEFYELSGLRAIGKIFTLIGNTNMTVVGRNWNCPRGTSDFRVYSGSPGKLVTLKLIDCITGTLNPRVTYATSMVGDKGETLWYSTFDFKIENGAGATVQIYNAENELVLDAELDEAGELTGQEILYRIYSQEKIGDSTWITIPNKYLHPFKAVVTKEGLQQLEIPGITITEGTKTIIRGSLTLPTYVDRHIQGAIQKKSLEGSIAPRQITGTIQVKKASSARFQSRS